jgi:hypothetical protein
MAQARPSVVRRTVTADFVSGIFASSAARPAAEALKAAESSVAALPAAKAPRRGSMTNATPSVVEQEVLSEAAAAEGGGDGGGGGGSGGGGGGAAMAAVTVAAPAPRSAKDEARWATAFPLHAAAKTRGAGGAAAVRAAAEGEDEAAIDEWDDAGLSPLHYAARAGADAAVSVLLEARAAIDAETEEAGVTPLHLAAAAGYPKTAALLLQHGAPPALRDAEGNSPQELAAIVSTNADFANADGPVSPATWATLFRLLGAAAAPQERLEARAEFAHDGLASLQARVRGNSTREALRPIVRKRVYPFLVKIVECSGAKAPGHDLVPGGAPPPNTSVVLTVHDAFHSGVKPPQLFSFRTSTAKATANPEWNQVFLVPGSNADATLVFTLFSSGAGGGAKHRQFLGQAALEMEGNVAFAEGTECELPLGPLLAELAPADEGGKPLPFEMVEGFAPGATLRVVVQPFPRGTVECGTLDVEERGSWCAGRFVVLAGRSIEIYRAYGDVTPMETIHLGGNARQGRSKSTVSTTELVSGLASGDPHSAGHLISVVDEWGSEFHLRAHDRRTAARWEFKIARVCNAACRPTFSPTAPVVQGAPPADVVANPVLATAEADVAEGRGRARSAWEGQVKEGRRRAVSAWQ